MNEMISLENVTKTYKDKTVVDKLSLSVGKGEVFALLGANGAGKTTTIKMILGLLFYECKGFSCVQLPNRKRY